MFVVWVCGSLVVGCVTLFVVLGLFWCALAELLLRLLCLVWLRVVGVNLFTLLWVALLMFDVFKFVMVVYCGCFNLV